MIRIAKMTDYGIALMSHIAAHRERETFAARDLAEALGLPRPTVSKLLKQLVQESLLASQRGSRGGYRLARHPEEITVARLIDALEGPVGMTECSVRDADSGCDLETVCGVRGNWQWINRKVMEALEGVTLADMAREPHAPTTQNGPGRRETNAMAGRQ